MYRPRGGELQEETLVLPPMPICPVVPKISDHPWNRDKQGLVRVVARWSLVSQDRHRWSNWGGGNTDQAKRLARIGSIK